jgi:hypothetical protein
MLNEDAILTFPAVLNPVCNRQHGSAVGETLK